MTLKNPRLVRRDASLPHQNSKARPNAKADPVNTQVLLDMVLNNMTQGVLMFEADTRLGFCNQRYLEMYRLSSALAKPGCALRDLLEQRMQAGTFSGDPDEYIAKLLERVAEGKTVHDWLEIGLSAIQGSWLEGGRVHPGCSRSHLKSQTRLRLTHLLSQQSFFFVNSAALQLVSS